MTGAGRDLSFLLGSYAVNAGLTLGLLWVLTQQSWGVTGIWISLLTFQVCCMMLYQAMQHACEMVPWAL